MGKKRSMASYNSGNGPEEVDIAVIVVVVIVEMN